MLKLDKATLQKHTMKVVVLVLLIALVSIIVILFTRLRAAEDIVRKAQPTPCLDAGRCIVGISFSDSIPGFRIKKGKEYFGFDVDLANYITKELGRSTALFMQSDRDSILTDPTKPVQMYISTVSMTQKRLEKMIFAGPYMRTFQGIVVNSDSNAISVNQDLHGKKICVAKDTTSEISLDEYNHAHPIDKEVEATTEDCIHSMKNKRVDAVTGDYITLETHAQVDKTLKPLPTIRLSEDYELYGIALPKDSLALCHKVAGILKDFVREKWEAGFDSNLKDLGVTYDRTNSAVPSLRPGDSLIDSESCKT